MQLNLRVRVLDLGAKLSGFIASSRRVLLISKKPDWSEFQSMSKVTALGIVVVGVIGYIVYLVFGLMGLQ